MKKVLIVAILAALSACANDPVTGEKRSAVERIRAAGEAARTITKEVRLTRCDLVPGATIEELRACPEE